MAQLRTLSSIIFRWGVEPLLSRIIPAIPSSVGGGGSKSTVKVIDLTTVPEDYKHLSSTITTLLRMVLPSGPSGSFSNTHITADLVDKHLADLIKPCIVLGWLPKSLSSESVVPLDVVRPLIVHVLSKWVDAPIQTSLRDADTSVKYTSISICHCTQQRSLWPLSYLCQEGMWIPLKPANLASGRGTRFVYCSFQRRRSFRKYCSS